MLTLVTLLTLSAAGPHFIEDDYAKALSQAKREKKLLFVDAWAPWCHTCVFMKEHVLNRPSFSAFEKEVVFSSIDTEKTKSAAFLKKHPIDVWPTLLFIDPVTEKVVFKWAGSADEAQMQSILVAAKATQSGDALFAQGDADKAADAFLNSKPAASDGRAVVSMLATLYLAKRFEPCAQNAAELASALQHGGDRINALSWGLGCAMELDEKNPARAKTLGVLVPQAKEALKLPDVFADDVSGLYETLVDERSTAKDDVGARALAADWLTFLEGAAGAAPTGPARAAFDAHRVNAAIASKQYARVLDALQLSELQMPADYNPPARLARVYSELGRFDDAAKAIDRALTKNKEGPRRVCLFKTKATILQKNGDLAGKREAAKAGLAYAKTLPESKGAKGCAKGLDTMATE